MSAQLGCSSDCAFISFTESYLRKVDSVIKTEDHENKTKTKQSSLEP